ncbi:CoxG family protein [Lentibacillus sp. Marseille-P4043]|uniref:CoxG family protein n=1 Tax=Lentibacillus sp. Marseille-P4043 TaxID=2040293 RepID=UPI000D0B6025|nr:SRPBCC family protein [Lentibacillus sp. Marseille-P4043]
MPSGEHQLELDIPIEHVWSFVSDMNKWAPLVPGYMEHEILHERKSTWKFKGEIGIIQKTVHLQIDITKWQEPTRVTFNLTGLNENVKGNGYFVAKTLAGNKTEVTSYLGVTAKGMKGPVINSVLKSLVPKTTRELTEAIATNVIRQGAVTV